MEGENLGDQAGFPDLVAKLDPVATIIVDGDADGVPRSEEIDHGHPAVLLSIEIDVNLESRLSQAPSSVSVVLSVEHRCGEHQLVAEQRKKRFCLASVEPGYDLLEARRNVFTIRRKR